MVDYWSRLILAVIIGVGIGLSMSHFLGLGNHLSWVLGFVGVSLATETSFRTIKNVKAPPNPILDNTTVGRMTSVKMPPIKRQKRHF
jgi:hypothetical protein